MSEPDVSSEPIPDEVLEVVADRREHLPENVVADVCRALIDAREALRILVDDPPSSDCGGYSGCAYCGNIYGEHYARQEPCKWEQFEAAARALLPKPAGDAEGR